MKRNVGAIDRAVRIVTGLVIIMLGGLLGVWLKSWWGLVGLAGLIPLVVGLVGWCPLYLPFGINTCSNSSDGTEAKG